MTRKQIFEDALLAARTLFVKYDWSRPLESAIEQLQYLVDLEEGRTADRAGLARINIGVIAAREIEDMDEATADKIHRAAKEAREMQAI